MSSTFREWGSIWSLFWSFAREKEHVSKKRNYLQELVRSMAGGETFWNLGQCRYCFSPTVHDDIQLTHGKLRLFGRIKRLFVKKMKASQVYEQYQHTHAKNLAKPDVKVLTTLIKFCTPPCLRWSGPFWKLCTRKAMMGLVAKRSTNICHSCNVMCRPAFKNLQTWRGVPPLSDTDYKPFFMKNRWPKQKKSWPF